MSGKQLRMRNGHQKLHIYQILLPFCVDIPPQGMNFTLILTILSNIPPVILPSVLHSCVLLLIQVCISLFRHLVLRHICRYIHFITQTIIDRQIHTFSKHERFSNVRIPKNSQQFTLLFFGKMR